MARDYYEILGVSRQADAAEMKSAFRKAAMQHHPDKGGDPHLFDAIQKAYSALSDPSKRMEYDASLKRRPVQDLKKLSSQLAHQFCNA